MLRYMIKFKHDTLVKEYKRVNFPKIMFRFKSFEDILSKKEIDEKMLIDGEVRICSSFDATQLFFNHPCKEFRELRNSYNTKLTPLRCIQSSSRLCGANMDFSQGSNDLVVTQIEDIYSKKNLGEYWVAGRIVDVESVVDWYYVSCKDNYCKRKLIEKGGMMVCGGCKSSWHEGVVRYKVIVRVADDTGDAPMLIWDRECSDLVGVSASDLLAKYPEGNKGIPPELGRLRGLSMLFRILMKKDQAESYYSAFTVLSICRDENALAQHCSNLLGSSERDGFSGDGNCVSGDFFSSDEEDCVAIEEVSQGSGLEKVTGLEDFEEGFGVDGAGVTLKRSLLKDFHRCGSSKKSKGIAVNEEK
nr:uncharacterized protein LOC109171655 [Ipomoea trifida]